MRFPEPVVVVVANMHSKTKGKEKQEKKYLHSIQNIVGSEEARKHKTRR